MEALLPFVIVGLVLALVIGGAIYSSKKEKERADAFARLASSLGFDFGGADNSLLAQLQGFHLVSQGGSKSVRNLIRARTEELGVDIFDYSYVTGSGKNRHTWRQTVLRFQMPQHNLPDFSLRPENVFHRIGGWLGYKDIDFETHPRFSGMFLLRGGNEEAIRQLFTSSLLELFEAKPGISVEAAGSQVIVYRHNIRTAPEQIRGLMEEGFAIRKAIVDSLENVTPQDTM